MWRYIQLGENSFLPTYNLFIGIGIALAMLYLQFNKEFKQLNNHRKYEIHLGLLVSVIFGFIGAYMFDAYTQGIRLSWNNLNQVGLTLWGGIATGLLTLSVFLKLKKIEVLSSLDMLVPAFCISHFFGRVGCFFAGCCYGSPTNSIFGMQFPKDVLADFHDNVSVHPTQLYESAFILLIFLLLLRSDVTYKFLVYLLLYSFFRFNVEFIRGDNRGVIFSQSFLTPSQFISLIFFVCGLILLYKRSKDVTHNSLKS